MGTASGTASVSSFAFDGPYTQTDAYDTWFTGSYATFTGQSFFVFDSVVDADFLYVEAGCVSELP